MERAEQQHLMSDDERQEIEDLLATTVDDCQRAQILFDHAHQRCRSRVPVMLELGRRSLEHALVSGDTLMICKAYNLIGVAHGELREYHRSLDAFEEALRYSELLGDVGRIGSTLANISRTCSHLGDYQRAIEFLYRALQIHEELGNRKNISLTLNSLGVLYGNLGQKEKGLEYLHEALAVAEKIDDRGCIIDAYHNIGGLYGDWGKDDVGIGYTEKALELSEQSCDLRNVTKLLSGLGGTYLRMGMYEKALPYLQRSLEMNKQLGDRSNELLTCRNIAAVHMNAGEYQQALDFALRALDLAERSEDQEHIEWLHEVVAEIYEAMGDLAEAMRHYREHLQLKEAMLESKSQHAVAELQVKYELERTRQQREELRRRLAEAEHTAIRSQINPHFLSNALNSIQYFIATSDRESAHRYLSRFARLIRLVLDHARQSLVTIAEELETVRLYLELEKLRFNDRIDYTITVDPALDQDAMMLPSMIVQPYIENALRHGILPKKYSGRVTIEIRQIAREQLLLIIEDDGIGRSASMALRETTDRRHESLGMQLIDERLRLLERIFGQQMEVRVIDLHDQREQPTGTRIEISLPSDMAIHQASRLDRSVV